MEWLICGCWVMTIVLSNLDVVSTGKNTVSIKGKTGMISARLNHCVIPSAENTIYQMMGANSNKEHMTLQPYSAVKGDGTVVVHIKCTEGVDRMSGGWFGQDYMICYDGKWYPPNNVCIKHCPPIGLDQPNSSFKCSLEGEPVSCKENVRPKTVAEKTCKPGHHDNTEAIISKNICLDSGEWSSSSADCFISCDGRDKKFKSDNADLMELVATAWIGGVYRWDKNIENFVLVCSATVVGTDVLVTAAPCVQDDAGVALNTDLVRIVLGKSYSTWNDERDIHSQTLEVLTITDNAYHAKVARGIENAFEMLQPMSFLFLKDRIEFSSFIRPLCVNTETSNTKIRYLNGTVTGWDETGKRFSVKTTFYKQSDCKRMISELQDRDEKLEKEIMKLGNYCTDKVFPASFLGTGAVIYNPKRRAEFNMGVLTGMYKSFSIFVGLRTNKAIETMISFYFRLIDRQRNNNNN